MDKINLQVIKNLDNQDMFSVLMSFPRQMSEAVQIGRNSPLFQSTEIPQKIIILGMGGSAIGGDLLRSYASAIEGASHLNIVVNRGYDLPGFVDDSWFVIVSSYSGGTEETISSYEQAKKKSKNIFVITAGGEIEKLAKADGFPTAIIPGGLMPRCGLGYSFVTMLFQLMRIHAFQQKAIEVTSEALIEIENLLGSKAKIYSEINDKNPAIELAKKLAAKQLIFHSAESRLDVVNLRWRGQIQENAKQIAFGSLLPEMNHNEINSWSFPEGAAKGYFAIFLKDKEDHRQTKKRFGAIEQIYKDFGIDSISLEGDGKSLLARMFDLIYLADWTSYWLALVNGIDPTPIPVISKLKILMAAK